MASEDRLNAIISAVATAIRGVTGIGHVHPYLRWAISDANFESLAVTGGVVNLWQVTRTDTEERWLTAGQVWRAHTIAIYGAYGLLDSEGTERTFQALVERVATRFRSRPMWSLNLDAVVESTAPYMGALASTSERLGARAGIQVQSIEHRNVSNKLVHWCQLNLGVQETPEALTD
jgi:hypothetical protein